MMLTRELEEGEKQAMKGANYTKNLFYLMTCIATFNCIIRSDYNFAFGLMGYYMIKTVNIKKIERTAYTVSTIDKPSSNLTEPAHIICHHVFFRKINKST